MEHTADTLNVCVILLMTFLLGVILKQNLKPTFPSSKKFGKKFHLLQFHS